jgi:pimeloyl-ACP methyl ester carboxylesterase
LINDTINYLDPAPNNRKIILLIHGLGSDSTSWQLQIPTLIQIGYRPIAIDVPGFGKSDYPYKRWTIASATKWITKNLVDQQPGKFDLMGLSMGGVIAQRLIKERPDKIDKVILVSTFSHLHPNIKSNFPYLSKRLLKIITHDLNSQAKIVADRVFPFPEQIQWHNYLEDQLLKADPVIYRQAMLSLAAFNSRKWLPSMNYPFLVVSGDKDSTVTIENQERLVKLLLKCEWKIIHNGNHAVNVDHVLEFNKAMVEFLNKEI